MEDTALRPRKKAGKLKTILFFIVLALLIAGVAWAVRSGGDGGRTNTMTSQPKATETPDPVKAQYGPNGDTAPSPDGLGPGASSTMMGNQQ